MSGRPFPCSARRELSRACGLGSLLLALLLARPLAADDMDLDELLELNLDDLVSLEVVSALRTPATIDQVPATVRVITAEQIAENGYLTLEDALADLPGIQFRNIQGFNSYVFMRGVPSQNNKILLLVDGVQINELNSGGFYGGGQFNLANVERIEVVYGPASALYGTNAVSGIIHILTRKGPPPGKAEGSLRTAAGSFDTRLHAARYGFGGDESDFVVAGMAKRTDKTDLGGADGDNNWTDAIDNFEDDEAYEGTWRWKGFSGGVLHQDKEASRATVQKTIDQPLLDHGVNWHIRFTNAWLSYAVDRPERWSLRSTAYYRDSTVLDDTIPVIEAPTATAPGRQYRWYRPNDLVGNETQATWIVGSKLTTSFGFVLEHERLAEDFSISSSDSATERPPRPARPERLTNDLVSLFGEARFDLAGGAEFFVGVRHDDSSYYGTVTTPRAGLVARRGRLTGKLLYMEAFRAPRPWDYTSGIGNPDLEPEDARSIELALAYLPSEHVRAELTLHRGTLDGLLIRENLPEGFRWVNGGRLETQGLEATAELRQGKWKGWANYTFTEATGEDGRQVPEIARHGANVGVSWAPRSGLSFGLRGNYVGSRLNPTLIPATGNRQIDDAFILHASASAQLPVGFELRLLIDNLGDDTWYHPSNLPPSRYRQAERSARLELGWTF